MLDYSHINISEAISREASKKLQEHIKVFGEKITYRRLLFIQLSNPNLTYLQTICFLGVLNNCKTCADDRDG